MILGFFEALFGSLYLGGRYAAESLSEYSAKISRERNEQISNTLESIEAESDLFKEASKNGYKWVYTQIPEQDLEYVFGSKWRRVIEDYYKSNFSYFKKDDYFGSVYNFYDISSILFNILLSQQGHIRFWRYMHGYQRGFGIKGIEHEERYNVADRTCKIIERNIQRAHPDLNIYLCRHPYRERILAWNTDLNSVGIKTTPYFPQNND